MAHNFSPGFLYIYSRLAFSPLIQNWFSSLAINSGLVYERYRIVTPADGTWGAKLENGTWSGMVGQVSRQEVDIALGPFGITESRSKIVDFTRSFYFDDRSVLVGKGVPEVDSWFFLHPFSAFVWVALLATLLVAWLALLVLGHHPSDAGLVKWASHLLFRQLQVLLQQDATVSLFLGVERLVGGGWVVVAMMFMWSYQGILVSLLAVRHIPHPIQTIRDLVDHASLTVIMEPNTIVTDTISKIRSGELKELNDLKYVGRVRYEHAKMFPWALDTLVRRHTHVVISTSLSSDLFIADLFARTGRCDFYKARQTFFSSTNCIIGQKGSPIVPVISYRIRPLVESGLYGHWLVGDIPFLVSCRASPSSITVRESLTLTNIWGTLVLLGSGFLLASLVFCLELCFARRCSA
ncbi:glutamate receptor isoform X2 [Procambarus clarkii]|uniref:glutamate receptor isoform X2 n=1 Tax=Procambarus clarkii TaxID=6728 RepID=UPI003742A21B